IPPGLPDCYYHNIASHNPETSDQFAAWRLFVVASRFYVGVMFIAFMMLIVVLEIGYTPDGQLRGGTLLVLLPGMLFFTFDRFDLLPGLLTALSFACLGRNRIAGAALFLGLAALIKVYPVLFVPVILRYLWPRRGEALRFAAIFTGTSLLALWPLLTGA